jgi:hypothetical protein
MTAPPVTPTNLIDPIPCPKCSERAYIIRRTIDLLNNDGSEVWTFACINGHFTERSGQR